MDSFGFLRHGRIEAIPLLALPFVLGLKIMAPRFVPCDDVTETHTLPRGTAANDSDTHLFGQSLVPPSADAEPSTRNFFSELQESLIMACMEPWLMPT